MDVYQSFLDLCDKVSFTKNTVLWLVLVDFFFSGAMFVVAVQVFIRFFRKLKLHFQNRRK